jgi:N-methylhydantoinase A
MRYGAQSFTIQIDLTAALRAGGEAAVQEAFHAEHERLFGHANRDAPVAIDTLRIRTMGRQAKPSGAPLPPSDRTTPAPLEHRRLRFGRSWVEDVPIYDWATLPPRWSASGPAVVQQDLATILVPPGYAVQLGLRGDLELARS